MTAMTATMTITTIVAATWSGCRSTRWSASPRSPWRLDFYRFRAKAGDILAIETLPGLTALDTVIGIFDDEGTLWWDDDDGGAGMLSRLLVQIEVDGTYSVGVSTFPDLGFTGAGEDFGRYVLNISSYRGTCSTSATIGLPIRASRSGSRHLRSHSRERAGRASSSMTTAI